MRLTIDAVRDGGQPPQEVWPYLVALPSRLSAWAPPKNSAPIFRHPMVTLSTEVSSIFSALNSGQPALFAARVTEQFYVPPTDHIVKAVPGDRDAGNHGCRRAGNGWRRCRSIRPHATIPRALS